MSFFKNFAHRLIPLSMRRIQRSQEMFPFSKRSFRTTSKSEEMFDVKDEDDFRKRILKNKKPVIVQFHASWCLPCKKLGPILEKSVTATKGAVDLARIDIDEAPEVAIKYRVEAVPAVVTLLHGKVIDKFIGLKNEKEVKIYVEKHVKHCK